MKRAWSLVNLAVPRQTWKRLPHMVWGGGWVEVGEFENVEKTKGV